MVDIAWSLPGYTAGQFPLTAVFELPFVGDTSESVSQAMWEYYPMYLKNEYKDWHVIALHSTDRGLVHTKKPINTLEDLKGVKLRAASFWVGKVIKALGAVPVGMPLPALSEALSRGQIQGMMIPWSITGPYKLANLTSYHTEIQIYHSPFAMLMNKKKWEGLPAEFKKAINDSAGMPLVKRLGIMWDQDGLKSRKRAEKLGNKISSLKPAEEARWVKAMQPVLAEWVAVANAKGLDGKKMLADAENLVKKYRK